MSMKKILFGFILISLCVLISSCENFWGSNQCDCEIVISNYNYTISEWEEIDRYFHEQNIDDGGCADRTILSTGDWDTTSTIITLHGLEDTTYEVEPGVVVYIYGPMSNGGWDFDEDTTYYTERISGYKEELDCPMYYN